VPIFLGRPRGGATCRTDFVCNGMLKGFVLDADEGIACKDCDVVTEIDSQNAPSDTNRDTGTIIEISTRNVA
jgi:hypothetical protein